MLHGGLADLLLLDDKGAVRLRLRDARVGLALVEFGVVAAHELDCLIADLVRLHRRHSLDVLLGVEDRARLHGDEALTVLGILRHRLRVQPRRVHQLLYRQHILARGVGDHAADADQPEHRRQLGELLLCLGVVVNEDGVGGAVLPRLVDRMHLHARIARRLVGHPPAVQPAHALALEPSEDHVVHERLRRALVDLHKLGVRLGRRAKHKLLGRAVVEKVAQRPLVRALSAQLALLDHRLERVLLHVLRLVLALHLVVEEQHVSVGEA